MNRLFTALVVLFLAGGLAGCQDGDDGNTSASKVLTFQVPVGGAVVGDRYWIIVSDAEGKRLDDAELLEGKTYTFKASSSFQEESVTMSLFRYNILKSLADAPAVDIQTYAEVPFGAYACRFLAPGGKLPDVGGADLTLLDFYQGGNATRPIILTAPDTQISRYESIGDNPGSAIVSLALTNQKAEVLLGTVDKGLFRYVFDEVHVGDRLDYSMSDFILGDTAILSIPGANAIRCFVTGTNDQGQYMPYFIESHPTEYNASITIPYVSGFFKSYLTNVSYTTGDGTTGSYILTSNTLPRTIKSLAGDIQYVISDNVIESKQPAGCDMVRYAIRENWYAQSVYWEVTCGPGNRTVIVPDMPASLADAYGVSSFARISANAYTTTVNVLEYPEVSGYSDWLNQTLVTNPKEMREVIGKGFTR